MSDIAENTFKQVIRTTPTPPKPSLWKECLHKPLSWSIFAGIVIFLFLFITNPPFIQKQKTKELTRPGPNLVTILIWSLIGAAVVAIGPWWSGEK